MAKHGRRRRKFRRYLKGQIDLDMLLGTLGAESLISQAVPDVLVEQAYCTSIKASYTMQNYTKQANDGPILIGVAHGDYTSAEIEQWVENLASWDQSDLLSQEIARRKIRMIGQFDASETINFTARLRNGMQFTTKCGWQLSTGETLRFWAYNQGSSALATSDPVVHVSGHANLWPN